MARGRKGGPSRMDLRRQAEAAEAQEEREDEEDTGEEGEEAEAEAEDEESGTKKKASKKKAPAKKAAAKPRVRTQKEVRQRAVWRIFDNSSKALETFPYNQKEAAEAFLAKVQEEKKGPFYLNLVKEEIKE